MKLLHVGDLHLGKRINERSLIDDQVYILNQILDTAIQKNVGGILVAGDIYDKSVPSIEAVNAFNDFLDRANQAKLKLFIIAGNHDSQQRLQFGSALFKKQGVYIEGIYQGSVVHVDLDDNVTLYLLPFIRPQIVRPYFETAIDSYQDAMTQVLSAVTVNSKRFNILVAHQFVVSGSQEPLRSDSETVSIGGIDSVDTTCFEAFDYVALGHIHRPQYIGKETIRYAGSPLVYSQSEVPFEKKILVLDIQGKTIDIEKIPFKPLRRVRTLKGSFNELIEGTYTEDYCYIVIDDVMDVSEGALRLRAKYPNLLSISFSKHKNIAESAPVDIRTIKEQTVEGLFESFYESQNHQPMSVDHERLVLDVLKGSTTNETT